MIQPLADDDVGQYQKTHEYGVEGHGAAEKTGSTQGIRDEDIKPGHEPKRYESANHHRRPGEGKRQAVRRRVVGGENGVLYRRCMGSLQLVFGELSNLQETIHLCSATRVRETGVPSDALRPHMM